MNRAESETRPVLGPAGNKARTMDTQKQVLKPLRKEDKTQATDEAKGKKAPSLPASHPRPQKQSILLKSSLSLNASCSSEASSDSSYSRSSTGRMTRRRSVTPSMRIRRKQYGSKSEQLEKVVIDADGGLAAAADTVLSKKRCAWVTPNTDPCYAALHDEEWGVPVHDDKKLFELLVLSTALAELSWPAILNRRHMFREVFMDFDPIAVSKLNEKKILTPGSTASCLLSELKLRAIIDNARQISKIIEELGSFDKYIWGFVNHKPIVGHFRYPRQVPIKTSKADAISKDLVRKGFRGVGPTVVYSFMQVAGITNDHLISCFRFHDCVDEADAIDKDDSFTANVEDKQHENSTELEIAIDDLSLSRE